MCPPIDYKEYPANWKTEIRPAVMARAGEVRNAAGEITTEACCEGCGVQNHDKGARNFRGDWISEKSINGMNSDSGEYNFQHIKGFPKIITIVLTVAHLDHDKKNHEVTVDRLRAWCQKCHLNYDRDIHKANYKRNRKKKTGKQDLFTDQK